MRALDTGTAIYTTYIGARLHARFTGNNNGNQAMRPSREHSCQFYVPPYGIKSAASCLCSLHCWGRANGASRFLLGLIVTPWVAIVCVCVPCARRQVESSNRAIDRVPGNVSREGCSLVGWMVNIVSGHIVCACFFHW